MSGYRNFQQGAGQGQFTQGQFGQQQFLNQQQFMSQQQHTQQGQFTPGAGAASGLRGGSDLRGQVQHTPNKRDRYITVSSTMLPASFLASKIIPFPYDPTLQDIGSPPPAIMDPALQSAAERAMPSPALTSTSKPFYPTRSPQRYLAQFGHTVDVPKPAVPANMPPTAQTAALASAAEAQRIALELAKRRSRKPTDKNIPEGVEKCVIGDGVAKYKRLREVERRLDAGMMRKRMDIVDGRGVGMKRFRTLRVWISNTVEDQEWQGGSVTVDAFDFTTRRDASWKVKIEGRLLDEEEEDDDDSDSDDEDEGGDKMDTDKKKPAGSKYRFSHFFKSLAVDFSKSRSSSSDFPEISWKKPILPANARNIPETADFDALEFKRGGDENLNVVIKLVRDEQPERYKLSRTLRELMDCEEATRAEVVTGIWEYVRAMGLQDEEDRRGFRCDELLKQIFNRETFSIPFIQDHLSAHMQPLPPIELPYTIRVDKAFHESKPQPTIYDIQLPLDSTLRLALQQHLTSPSYAPALQEISKLNDETAVIIAALQHSRAKHIFLENLAKNPVEWLNKWVNSQQRDLDIIKGETVRTGENVGAGEEWRKGGDRGAWGTEGAREAAAIYLHRDATNRGVKDRV